MHSQRREQCLENCRWLFNQEVQIITFLCPPKNTWHKKYTAVVLPKLCSLKPLAKCDDINEKVLFKAQIEHQNATSENAVNALLNLVEARIGEILKVDPAGGCNMNMSALPPECTEESPEDTAIPEVEPLPEVTKAEVAAVEPEPTVEDGAKTSTEAANYSKVVPENTLEHLTHSHKTITPPPLPEPVLEGSTVSPERPGRVEEQAASNQGKSQDTAEIPPEQKESPSPFFFRFLEESRARRLRQAQRSTTPVPAQIELFGSGPQRDKKRDSVFREDSRTQQTSIPSSSGALSEDTLMFNQVIEAPSPKRKGGASVRPEETQNAIEINLNPDTQSEKVDENPLRTKTYTKPVEMRIFGSERPAEKRIGTKRLGMMERIAGAQKGGRTQQTTLAGPLAEHSFRFDSDIMQPEDLSSTLQTPYSLQIKSHFLKEIEQKPLSSPPLASTGTREYDWREYEASNCGTVMTPRSGASTPRPQIANEVGVDRTVIREEINFAIRGIFSGLMEHMNKTPFESY